MKRALAWLAGLAMVAAAAAVGHLTLTEGQQQSPFVVQAALGDPAVGRTFAVTVEQVRAADAVADAGGWHAAGNWVVVDLEAQARESETASILTLIELRVGEVVYGASERPVSLVDTPLSVGLPQSGSIAFELPESLTSGAATLRLGRTAEDRLDSVAELQIDLAALERRPSIELRETAWAQ
ncbi:hypothetical protein [Agrococcus baldri]|uniref:DUF4352 domain-containing protein n=1 Tax=Agrococcus baldri TaxID=153730 RepID=A0AA87RHG2_9MICO|nr:hypothetical protein [Agrococcus baldri]GEK80471.1 hypothetical protein ABA31_18220 [Agrococcus baldri]